MTSLALSLEHWAGTACGVLERYAENAEVETLAADHGHGAAPAWTEIPVPDGLEVESLVLVAALGRDFGAGSVGIGFEAAGSSMTVKAVGFRLLVSRPRNSQHEDQHDASCGAKESVDDDDAAEDGVVEREAIAAEISKEQRQ